MCCTWIEAIFWISKLGKSDGLGNQLKGQSKYPSFAQHNIADSEWTMTLFGDSYVSVQS